MSGRIRSIKPEWLEDEIALLSLASRVLSVALLLMADDYGNGRAHPAMLAARVFALEPQGTLEKALGELTELGFVQLYEVNEQHYFHIRNWSKHQKVDKPGRPLVPAPPGLDSRSVANVREQNPPKDFVYFLQEGEDGPIKIGRSWNPQARVPKLATGTSGVLRLILSIPGGWQEKDFHKRFAHLRIKPNGEWFSPGPELVEFIRERVANIREPFAPDQDLDQDQDQDRRSGSVARPRARSAATDDSKPEVTEVRKREPATLDEALKLPVRERAELVVLRPDLAQWICPQKWPEVAAVAERLHKAARLGSVRLGQYSRDNGVQAVVALFADGYSLEELLELSERIPKSEWWAKGAQKGLSSLTPEVVRRSAKAPGLVLHEQTSDSGLPAGWSRHPNQPGWYLDSTGATRRNLPRAS